MDWMIVVLVYVMFGLFAMTLAMEQGSNGEKIFIICMVMIGALLLFFAYLDGEQAVLMCGGFLKDKNQRSFMETMLHGQVDHYTQVERVLVGQERVKLLKRISILVHDGMNQGLVSESCYKELCNKSRAVL
jgi:hypothetical protein